MPEHSFVHHSWCHITALEMVSLELAEKEQTHCCIYQFNKKTRMASDRPASSHMAQNYWEHRYLLTQLIPKGRERRGTRSITGRSHKPHRQKAGVIGGRGVGTRRIAGELAKLVPVLAESSFLNCRFVVLQAAYIVSKGSIFDTKMILRVWQHEVLSKSVSISNW